MSTMSLASVGATRMIDSKHVDTTRPLEGSGNARKALAADKTP
jgi:hypothetical protein